MRAQVVPTFGSRTRWFVPPMRRRRRERWAEYAGRRGAWVLWLEGYSLGAPSDGARGIGWQPRKSRYGRPGPGGPSGAVNGALCRAMTSATADSSAAANAERCSAVSNRMSAVSDMVETRLYSVPASAITRVMSDCARDAMENSAAALAPSVAVACGASAPRSSGAMTYDCAVAT